MAKNYREIIRSTSVNLKNMHTAMPETMKGFSALNQAATEEGVLSKKTKELIALALAVATHCDACIGFHVLALVKLGCSRGEVEEAMGVAMLMGGGPAMMYASDALGAFDELSAEVSE